MAKERKASVIYEGNASQLVYAFPFDYLRKKFVKVEDIYTNITELTIGVDYTVEDKQVRLVKGIPLGHSVKIYRETTTAPLVEWQDASVLRSADLSLQEVQLLHLAEETADKVFDSGMSSAYDNPNCWDGQYKRIINALDPIEDGDVVTLRYIKANQDSLLNQLKNTGAAQNSSIVATGDSQNARLDATGDNQNTRLTTTGDTQNKRLTDTGDSYVATMTTLKDTATTKATEASNSADLAKKWAVSASSPDGAADSKSSKTWAEEAKGSASNAASYATDAHNSSVNANSRATDAHNSAANAVTQANNAASSASAAATSASTATTKATAAAQSATQAANSASAAAKSAENAKTWDPTQYAKLSETLLLTKHGKKLFETNTAITDLNAVDVLSYPTWFCGFSYRAEKLTNCPTKTGFHLFNMSSSESADGTYNGHLPTITTDWVYIVQILIDLNSNVWVRKCTNNGTSTFTFTPWVNIATTDYVDNAIATHKPDLSSYYTKSEVDAKIPTKTSQLTNDSGFAQISNGHLVINGSELWIE